jgi:DNA polymerase-3 subunit gamma/tau
MATINSVNSDGLDLRQFNRELVEYLRGLLLVKTGSANAVDLTAEDLAELKALAAKAHLGQILKAVKLFGQLELGLDNYSSLPLELALVDCVLPSWEEKKSPTHQARGEFRQPAKVATPPVTPTPPKQQIAKAEPASAPEPAPPEIKPVPASTPEPASPEIEPVPATPPELTSEIERLRLNWRQIIEDAPPDIKKTNAIALLRSAGVRPVAIEDGTVVLAFRYNIHKENMEKPENQQIAEKIISNFLGRPYQVRCVYEPKNNHLVKAALQMGAQVTSVEEK